MNEDKAWIARIIESSVNDFHLAACHALINLFCRKYGTPFEAVEGWEDAATDLKIALDCKDIELDLAK
jgi:hypothetical protein